MSSGPKKSGMGHISLEDFQKGKLPLLSLPTPSPQPSKPTTPSNHKRAATDPTPPLTSHDKDAIARAIEELKQAQESTNDWFRRIESLRQVFDLPGHSVTLAESEGLAEQLTAFARDTTWIEQEAARVDAENFNLEQEIKTLQSAIAESQELLTRSSEADLPQQKSTISSAVLLTVSVASFLFIFILLADSFSKGTFHTRFSFM